MPLVDVEVADVDHERDEEDDRPEQDREPHEHRAALALGVEPVPHDVDQAAGQVPVPPAPAGMYVALGICSSRIVVLPTRWMFRLKVLLPGIAPKKESSL